MDSTFAWMDSTSKVNNSWTAGPIWEILWWLSLSDQNEANGVFPDESGMIKFCLNGFSTHHTFDLVKIWKSADLAKHALRPMKMMFGQVCWLNHFDNVTFLQNVKKGTPAYEKGGRVKVTNKNPTKNHMYFYSPLHQRYPDELSGGIYWWKVYFPDWLVKAIFTIERTQKTTLSRDLEGEKRIDKVERI
jgi:hypothetical protein